MFITKTQKIRLGIFVTTACTVLLLTIIVLGGSRCVKKWHHYWIGLSSSATGLEMGSAVKYRGVQVGRVEKIRVDPDNVARVIVDINIDTETPIKADTRAVVEVLGITGLKYIDLIKSTSESATLSPGSEILEEPSLIEDLSGRATAIALKTEQLLQNLINLTGGGQGKEIENIVSRVNHTMGEVETLISEMRSPMVTLTQNLSKSAITLNDTLKSLQGLLQDNRSKMKSILGQFETVAKDLPEQQKILNDLLKHTNETILSVNTIVGSAELKSTLENTERLIRGLNLTVARGQENLDATLKQLNETTENMKDFSRFILENPSALFRNIEQEEREFQ